MTISDTVIAYNVSHSLLPGYQWQLASVDS